MEPGEVIVRREVWRGQVWSALPVVVIEDSPKLLAVHVQVGAPFGFAAGHPLGVHPWSKAQSWQGLDVVMLQRPDEAHSVWFIGSRAIYVNLQAPFRRTPLGVDTFDHELDLVIAPDGTWTYKDQEQLEASVAAGRFTEDEVVSIRSEGARVAEMIETQSTWWASEWSTWLPPDSWPVATLRPDWALDVTEGTNT
jgi:hypothetical protein